MIINRIALRNFRNYELQEIDFNPKFNFICGDNGHGKTNILEAVSYLTYGRSFLGSHESDCVRIGSVSFSVDGVFENDLGNSEHLNVSYDLERRSKSVHRNKERISSFASEVFGRYPVVFLSPASLVVTYGSPGERRKFFDMIISQASPVYLDLLKEYARLLKQKNALLRDNQRGARYSSADVERILASLNEKSSTVSGRIVRRRLEFLKEFANFFGRSYSFLNTEGHAANIDYVSDAFADELSMENDLEREYFRHFEEYSAEEIARGISLCGPQRDDYLFSMTKDGERLLLKSHASQGEHKTFLVALKLGEYEYLKSVKSTSPVLLLDDILSELDHSRVSQIVSHLRDYGQIFLTTADHSHIDKMKRIYKPDEMSSIVVKEGRAEYEQIGN